MDKLKVVDAAWHGMKGAWGMAKDQLTGDSGDDNYDPKLSVPDGDEAKDIGKIVKEAPHDFEDLVQQGMTDADNFTMSYPKDIDPRLKAAMAAALLLIDYQFFEDEGDCYCNPFRCVCGSATGVLQSSRRWRGGTSTPSTRPT